MFEDVGNGTYSATIVVDGTEKPCVFSIFNNSYGQICHIVCDTKEARIDSELQLIDHFKPNTMPSKWLDIAIVALLDILKNKA